MSDHTVESTESPPRKTVSGTLVVLVMFTLAMTATGLLWTYWHLHLMPFMPLQEALAEEFESSSPRVDGGRRKTHKGTPMTLRVVMRVPFNPTEETSDAQEQIAHRLNRTQELAIQHTAINEYEVLELHLYQELKEKKLHQKKFVKKLTATD